MSGFFKGVFSGLEYACQRDYRRKTAGAFLEWEPVSERAGEPYKLVEADFQSDRLVKLARQAIENEQITLSKGGRNSQNNGRSDADCYGYPGAMIKRKDPWEGFLSFMTK